MRRLSIVLSTLAMVLMACKSEPNQPIASTMNSEMSEETAVAIYASGCFWGTEYYMKRQEGVISTTVGYTGGHVDNPTYREVCSKTTGHYEAVKVEYDPSKVTYEELTRLFFETHDPTQANGQGPDIGPQYRSAIFVANESEREIAENLIGILEAKGLDIATEVKDAATFWDAEGYHQDYYDNKGGTPYCHGYRKLF
ncbi:MAG: peptide-methionine (S)-S-oxide reductase MsrA [Flavobacteriia bacterium]|nr:peptide-methionine (S)-S-oxide reductase MsrA [Flavobacteriia bacterium]